MPRRAAALGALAAVMLTLSSGVAGGTPDPPDPGQVTSGTVTSNGTDYEYLLYTPSSYSASREVPLVVVVHGCQTTAEQQMRASQYNELAEREEVVVLYPDVDALGRLLPGPANQCWKFPYPPSWTRDSSDAGAIADMTRAVMAARSIDAERVYVVGMSAGGLMAAIEAAAYPDLFATVGVVQSAGYLDGPCLGTGIGLPVPLTAQLAFQQMGPRARVVPTFVIGSTADAAFPAACADKAIEQGLRTNNLVISGRQDRPLALTPATVRQEQERGGRAYTVSGYHDPAGCLIAEKWIIDGMPHAWPGGTADPTYGGFTDPSAPSGAEASWEFFERYRRSDTAMPCATAEQPIGPPPTPGDPPDASQPPIDAGARAGAGDLTPGSASAPEHDDAQVVGFAPATPHQAGSHSGALPATGAAAAGWQPAVALIAALLLRETSRHREPGPSTATASRIQRSSTRSKTWPTYPRDRSCSLATACTTTSAEQPAPACRPSTSLETGPARPTTPMS